MSDNTVIYDMLKEEKERNLHAQGIYAQEIGALRKGSIMAKPVGNNVYYYLKYRDGNRVKNDYIGKDLDSVKAIEGEIKRRKHLQGVIKRLKKEYRQICKVVKE